MEILLYISVLSIYIFIIFKNLKQNNINSYNIFLIMICFAYIFVPIVVFCLGENYKDKYDILGNIYISTVSDRIKSLIYIISFTVFTCIGYNIKNIRLKKKENKLNKTLVNTNSKIYNKCKKYLWIILVIGLVGFLYVIYSFNGISSLLKASGAARGEGDYQILSGSVAAYSIILARGILGTVFVLILLNKLKKNDITKIGLCLMITLSVTYLIFNAGKLQIIIFLLPLLLLLSDKFSNNKIKIIFYIGIVVLILIIMPQLDNLFYYIVHGIPLTSFQNGWGITDNIMKVLNSFTYPFSNLLIVDDMNRIQGLRLGVDYILPFINIIPSGILNIFGLHEINTLYNLTSEYYYQCVPGISGTGGVPNDILTVAIRQFSFAGTVLVGIVVGQVLKRIDSSIKKLNEYGKEYKILIYTNCMVIVAVLFLEPYSCIMAYFYIIPSIFLTRKIVKIKECEMKF